MSGASSPTPGGISESERRRALLALFTVQVLFSTFPVCGKLALAEIAPMALAALRAVTGAVFLTLAVKVFLPDEKPFEPKDRKTIAGLAAIGIVANQVLFISGLARTTAANATLLTAGVAVFAVLAAWLLFGERPSPRKLLGIPISIAGIAFLVGSSVALGSRGFVGDALIVANGICYAVFLVTSRGILARRNALAVTASLFRWACLPIVLLGIPDLSKVRPAELSGKAWFGILGVLVFSTLLSYGLNAWALARVGSSTTAIFMYVQPVLATTWAFLFLGERPGPKLFVAGALILAGVALATWPARSRTRPWPARNQTSGGKAPGLPNK